MRFSELQIPGVYLIEPEKQSDERGSFARVWCRHEFAARGLSTGAAQCNISYNEKAETLRGLHYQVAPNEESKLVRCTRGAIYDVVLDLRRWSTTFQRWLGVEITAEAGAMVYVPTGCAHGFMTLMDQTEVFYLISEFYHSESARGVRWNDPAFGIVWPRPVCLISERDQSFPLFTPTALERSETCL